MAHPNSPDTRSKILIAAATMLGEDPTARLTVRAVAAHAGVSTGSLRHFFPTQQLLLDTVVEGLQTVEIADDPMADTSKSPADRLEACLRVLLTSVGTGAAARENWIAMHDAYIASPTPDESGNTFLAMERLGIGRVERWLDVLRQEGVGIAVDLEQAARFLLTVVNGLALDRALPGASARIPFEERSLRLAVDAVLVAGAS
ncbi:TetR/AcrR family transcriptional regulator [Curtobacterium sp. MCLR17_007]|uniref:TetR/AcrR family transcriptional regulator n=1 Tax=Curtobacterium sp. MCLR17_007 TaxID=2175648 RepID=UPI000DAA30DC|nr:TetR/AcrR family transcriptional regulator [Curtobacterium sp. MCLR17_007]WIB60206.1 TetR/AcrR family transcriptional regulator [Curtobacterium sp. MCLR17_007]